MIGGAYKPLDQYKSVSLESLSKRLSIYLDIYKSTILLGFNLSPEGKTCNFLQTPLI